MNQFTIDQGLPTLSYAVHDAVELAYLFCFELQLIPPRNCRLLLAGEPTSDSVKNHLAQLQQAGAKVQPAGKSGILTALVEVVEIARSDAAVLVCAISSHGHEFRDTPYVMPTDGSRRFPAETAVSLTTIDQTLQESKAGHRLLLVDACQERISVKTTGETNRGQPSAGSFAAALQQPTGQAKLASCSPGEFSFEHGSLGGVGHGVFTYEFLQALRGGAKPDRENIVRLGDVADYVAKNVTAWTTLNKRPRQTPFLQSPIATRQLPLAAKADDLTTLIATLERHPTNPAFTAELSAALATYLKTLRTIEGLHRELLQETRSFLHGTLNARTFAAFVRDDQTRWTTARLPRSPAGSPAVPVPVPAPSPTPNTSGNPVAGNLEGKQAGEVRSFTDLGVKFCWCPAGSFTMGSPASETDRSTDEDQVSVTLSRGFWLGQTEVTQGLWQSVMGTQPWSGKDYVQTGANYPAVYVSHGLGSDGTVEPDSATEFCRKLTARERAAGRLPSGWEYQLPTEAQWEYACRAGTTTPYNGDGTGVLGDYAWYSVNADAIGETYAHLVGQKKPNRWGLLDMHGNVWEWCQDWYGEKLPGGRNPVVSSGGSFRVSRGGSWNDAAWFCRSAYRNGFVPSFRFSYLGFRCALSPSGE